MPIQRTQMIDDDGSGTTGTVWNNAFLQSLYDQIDAALASGGWPGGIAGQVVFPATQNPSPGANVLDDYEEGSFTVADASGAGLSFGAGNTGMYVKVGQLVMVALNIIYPSTTNGANGAIGPIPFSANAVMVEWPLAVSYADYAQPATILVAAGVYQDRILLRNIANYGGPLTNAQLSAHTIRLGGVYRATA